MLRSSNELKGYTVKALEGPIGQVSDLFIDDQEWKVRYLIADTGSLLARNEVLIAPEALGEPDWRSRHFPVGLTRDQVKNSPHVDTSMPVSRQKELEYRQHFQWPAYWSMPGYGYGTHPLRVPVTQGPRAERSSNVALAEEKGSSSLRSLKEVTGYSIGARDGEIGHAEDFIVDDTTWEIRYLVVDTRNWLPGKKVLVAVRWIDRVSWDDKQIRVDLTRDAISNAPEFDPYAPVNAEYERRLYDYYGRPLDR